MQLDQNPATGYDPYFLQFERSPKLPIGVILTSSNNSSKSHSDYGNKWKEYM